MVAPPSSSFTYDVFLSFRGEDTRHGFTGADRWVLLVFYQVDPHDVRYQRGTYGEALAYQEQKFKDKPGKVRRHRMALHQASSLVGWHFKHRELISLLGVWQTFKRALHADKTWRLVGLGSSIVGMLCYALSPSFNRLIGGWNPFKFSLYGIFSLVICVTFTLLFARNSEISRWHVQLKAYMGFAVLMILSVYSYFYDRAVRGKPEILSLVSNAAFSLMSQLVKTY
ncbi:hypothetical protein RJT34_26087 [Clitoria ternatea]|uniref:ADP-ribosyl cyclase/cyclic ADP-ribose hydrolase n=1 Tax=Clitoria ternatea TaxID=43366 RepID=A0AAN9F6E7_CLITE